MRILVTGAAGLIGRAVAERLEGDHDVVGLDLNVGPTVQIVGDCLDVATWRHRLGGIHAVVHVAALHAPHVGSRSEAEFRRTNVEATSRLLDLALTAGASHFVLTSTTSLYGHSLDARHRAVWVDEALEPQPRDIYDETKLEAEELVSSAGGSMTVTSLRMSRCFPEAAGTMAGYRLHRGVDRRDVAEAHLLALQRMGAPASYVISARSPFEREDAAELLHDAPAVIERRIPRLGDAFAAKGWRLPRCIDRVYDCELAMRDLGYNPRFGIEACLKDDWDPSPAK